MKRKFEDITAEMIRRAVYEMKYRAGRVIMEDERHDLRASLSVFRQIIKNLNVSL